MSIQDFTITASSDAPLARGGVPRPEMHWSRWGDPNEAGPVSDSVRGLIDMFLGASDTPAVSAEEVALSAPLASDLVAELTAIVGADNVSVEHADRLLRTRGKSTPDLLKIRAGDGSESPDVVVRPGNAAEIEAMVNVPISDTLAVRFAGSIHKNDGIYNTSRSSVGTFGSVERKRHRTGYAEQRHNRACHHPPWPLLGSQRFGQLQLHASPMRRQLFGLPLRFGGKRVLLGLA